MAVLTMVIVTLTLGLVAVVAADDGGNRNRLDARLNGAQEVPPADADGRGRAEITLRPGKGQICWKMDFSRMGTPNAGHIHIGAAGTAAPGNVVFPLIGPLVPADPLNDQLERGRSEGCGTATEILISQIAANPAGYYVNLHNPRFPGGAIRGQLEGGGDDD